MRGERDVEFGNAAQNPRIQIEFTADVRATLGRSIRSHVSSLYTCHLPQRSSWDLEHLYWTVRFI